MTMTADEVARRWEQVAAGDDPVVRQGLIHPSGEAGEEAYRATGRAQAEALTMLAIEYDMGDGDDRVHVLDYGCGDGRVLVELDPTLFVRCGTDTSATMRERVMDRASSGVVVMPPDGMPLEAFRLVYCLAVLIHLNWSDGAELIGRMAAHVEPGGLLVLDVPLAEEEAEGGSWISVTSWSEQRLEAITTAAGLERVVTDAVPWPTFRRPA